MTVGTLSCLIWTLFYISYHIALLNFAGIHYTKTCVFTLFLASFANITLSISLQDPFSFIPNAISLVLCIFQFTKYTYKLAFNFSAYSFAKFIRFTKESNKAEFWEANEFSNNMLAKYNPNSIPNRRKKLLYEKQERMKANVAVTFDNATWMRQSIISDTASDAGQQMIHRSSNYFEYKSRVNSKYRGHGLETAEIKVFSILLVMTAILVHVIIEFLTEIFNRSYTERFNIIHGLLLFQWMLCLCFLLVWFQNYRFEYAIEQLLDDGYSLYYLMKDKRAKLRINDGLSKIDKEMQTLSMDHASMSINDTNLSSINEINKPIVDSEPFELKELCEDSDSDFSISDIDEDNINNELVEIVEETAKDKKDIRNCCQCLRGLGALFLRLVRHLPLIVFVNGCVWLFFGAYVCDNEVIWLQHSISIGVTGVYLLCSVCMNEKHLLLQKESQIITSDKDEIVMEENTSVMYTESSRKQMPNRPLPRKPLPPSSMH